MFQKLFEKLGRSLEKSKIPYMIIGGQAVLLYGESRLTNDIDLTLGIGPSELHKVVNLAQKIDLKISVKDPEEFVRKTFVLPTETHQVEFGLILFFL